MRLPDIVDAEVDASMLLPGYFEAAISWITERTRYPIFDQARSLYLPEDTAAYRRNSPIRYPSDILRNREDPIMIPLSHILSLTSVRYWTESGMRNQDPDGTISNLGRLELRFLSLQWPPDTGWPTGLEGMKYQFNFMRGVTESLGLCGNPLSYWLLTSSTARLRSSRPLLSWCSSRHSRHTSMLGEQAD